MTSTINASPSNGLVQSADGSGILKVQSNGKTTNALAWVSFNGFTNTIRSQYNIASITKNATGDFTLAFTNTMSDANYSIVGTAGASGDGTGPTFLVPNRIGSSGNESAPTTTSCRINTESYSGSVTDVLYAQVAIFGN